MLNSFGVMIKIKRCKPKHIQDVQELINQNFGYGYAELKCLIGPGVTSFVALFKQKVVGFCSAVEKEDYTLLDMIVVHFNFRKKGVGRRLFKKRLTDLKTSTEIRINHWIRKHYPQPFCAKDFGFTLEKITENKWFKIGRNQEFNCLECLKQLCVCDCAIYKKIS